MPPASLLPPESRPRLRPGLSAAPPDDHILLFDPHRIGGPPVPLTPIEFEAVQLFTGTRTLRDIQAAVTTVSRWSTRTGRRIWPGSSRNSTRPSSSTVHTSATTSSVRFAGLSASAAIRLNPRPSTPSCEASSSVPAAPVPGARASGPLWLPRHPAMGQGLHSTKQERADARAPARLRAVLVPHMDYARGGVTYGWGFKELVEQTDANLFVIVATSHLLPAPIHADPDELPDPARPGRDRPGLRRSNRGRVRRRRCSTTHSLTCPSTRSNWKSSYCSTSTRAGGRSGSCRCWSGRSTTASSPATDPQGRRTWRAWSPRSRTAEAAAGESVCYVISGDLAHIGPKFRDPEPVTEPWLAESQQQDEQILNQLVAADADGVLSSHCRRGRPADGFAVCRRPGSPSPRPALRRESPALQPLRPPGRTRKRQLRRRRVLRVMGTLTVTADELHAALARYDAEAVPGTLHTGRYRLRDVSWGTGPQTLVIIHGLADTARAFAAMMVNLVADFRCIAYELPNGCGDDAKIAAYRHADYAHDLLALLDHLNLETVNLLGSSFGNTVAVRATTLYPTRFRRVVLKSGFSRRPLDRWQRMLCRPARYWPGLMGDVPPVAAVMRRLEGPGFASAAPAALDFLLRNTGQAPIRTVARRALPARYPRPSPAPPQHSPACVARWGGPRPARATVLRG